MPATMICSNFASANVRTYVRIQLLTFIHLVADNFIPADRASQKDRQTDGQEDWICPNLARLRMSCWMFGHGTDFYRNSYIIVPVTTSLWTGSAYKVRPYDDQLDCRCCCHSFRRLGKYSSCVFESEFFYFSAISGYTRTFT